MKTYFKELLQLVVAFYVAKKICDSETVKKIEEQVTAKITALVK